MHASRRSSILAGNPVFASRQAQWANLGREVVSRPFLSSLLGVSFLCVIALVVAAFCAALVQHAGTLLDWMTTRAPVLWSAVFLLCLASQVPPARRDINQAFSGWLAALPQMPQAMHHWSRWRRWGIAIFESLGLAIAVAVVHHQADPEGGAGPVVWLAPLVVPALAALLAPGLAGRSRRSGRSPSRPVQVATRARRNDRILAQWQWAHYRSCCWRAGIRWSLGLLIVLMPAGAPAVQVGIALAVGLVLLQLCQLWSSALHVIFQASRLVRALPVRRWIFIRQVSGLPLFIALGLPLALGLVLAGLGMSSSGASIAGLAVFGVLTLNWATVIAWREEIRFSALRSAIVLLAWLALSQTAAFMAPLYWLVLFTWLVRRAGKEVS